MASTINATTSSGIVATADNTGSLALQTSGTTAVTIDTSQNLNIGQTSTPAGWGVQAKVSVKQSSASGGAGFLSFSSSNENAIFLGYDSTNSLGRIGVSYGSTGSFTPLAFETGGSERMRIDSNGNVQIGKTSNSTLSAGINLGSLPNFIASTASPSDGPYIQISNIAASVANGFRYISFRVGSSGNEAGSISTNGSSTVSYVTSSDYRLKDNIVPMTGALDKVLQLKPCTYTWKSDNSNGQGFIAHELAEIVPDCVTGEKDAVNEDGSIKPQGVDTSFLVATLTAAIQEQQTIINNLKARIETLENK